MADYLARIETANRKSNVLSVLEDLESDNRITAKQYNRIILCAFSKLEQLKR